MSTSTFSSEIARLEREIASLQQKVSSEEKKEVNLQNRILAVGNSINQKTSLSLIRSRSRQIERLEKEFSGTSRKKADLLKKLAGKSRQLATKREQLRRATEAEQKRQQRLSLKRDRQLHQDLESLRAQTARFGTVRDAAVNPGRVLVEVFVVEGEFNQGTCFNLAGVGLVTCQHVLAPSLLIFHPSSLTERSSVEEFAANKVIDLARVSAPGLSLGEGLPVGSADTLEVMDEIYVVGYPNYRLGDSGIVARGYITGFRNVSGIRRILIDTPIIAGNSGGPVLNGTGEVIGVAITGADRMENAESTENHGVVPIDALVLLSDPYSR